MNTWIVIAIALALAVGLPRVVIFRVVFPLALGGRRGSLRRRLHYFLHKHSAAYRRWCFQRFILAMHRTEKVIGERLLPAMKKTTAAIQEFSRALEEIEAA